ncbi:MAG: putative chromosome-partitioning protein ParB [Firmicutes bacterium ADurb.Bin182]|nr:MAG: putative chromosome-partitioning protein ParB [Firmicutes bacterium ADurb.Bin182]
MQVKKGLGKGLDALIGDYSASPETQAGVYEADILLLDTNLNQPRLDFDEEKLQELAESIKQHGIIQPIVVRQNGARYSIIAGERRYRAARMAGLSKVPVVLKDIDEERINEVALIENIQREDLNPMEEALAIRALIKEYDITQEEMSDRLGKSRPAIANALRLLSLAGPVQKMVREGKLSAGQARAIVSVKDEESQLKLASEAIKKSLSVRELEALVRRINERQTEKKEKLKPGLQPELLDVQEHFRERFGTRVSIQGNEKKGKIVIEYYSGEDLLRIYDVISGS